MQNIIGYRHWFEVRHGLITPSISTQNQSQIMYSTILTRAMRYNQDGNRWREFSQTYRFSNTVILTIISLIRDQFH